MSTTADSKSLWHRVSRSRWGVPAFAVVFGVGVFVIQAVNGDPAGGVVSLAIMLAYAAVLVAASRRSETVSLLRGEVPDERAEQIQLRAGAATGYLLVTVLVGGFVVCLATGSDQINVWARLCALSGVTYLASLMWFRWRS
jgi:class 3 adenylate cyclase